MTEDEWIKKLEEEGYTKIAVHTFEANQTFGDHTHDQQTIHIILKGGMTLTDKTVDTILKTGDRFEIPAGTTHSAVFGPEGCTFIAGVK
jgi:quercetin dioxygenase-like cupin family protein